MSFKLALNAGHGLNTAGKRCMKALDPNETREWTLNNRIADKIESLLAAYDGIEILRIDDTTGVADIALATRTTKANNWGADFYLAIHANAGVNGGTGGGIMAFVYTSVDSTTLAWQKELYDELIKLTGLKGNRSTPLAKANLHEVRETRMPAVLLELGFMDSAVDVPIILTEDFANKCAQACVNVVVARAGLKKKVVATANGKEYKVVKTINRYANVADAQAKANSKGTYEAGTYYIYNKYPDGLNGMYNISKDSTGASAGSWINPSENVVQQTTTTTTTADNLYRVRKSWDDVKSQIGAYGSLDNAKSACQSAGPGYSVFDSKGNVVYTYTAPATTVTPQPEAPKEEPTVESTPTPTPTAVYDLDYPVKTKIVDKSKSIDEKEVVRAIKYIVANNADFNIEIAKAFYKLAPKYGIDPSMAISQSILETGWFKYVGSAVQPEHHNYCGLGVTSTGITGGIFNTIEDGVTAQLQHLFAYGCTDTLSETIIDPRFKYVTRGIAPYWQNLAGRWAVPGYDKNTYATPEDAMKAENTYGQKILNICNKLLATMVSEDDIKKYLGIPEEEEKVETVVPETPTIPVEPTEPEKPVEPETSGDDNIKYDGAQNVEGVQSGVDTEKVNTILGILEKILRMILDFFTKK